MLSPEVEEELELMAELKESSPSSCALFLSPCVTGKGVMRTSTFWTVATCCRLGWKTRVVILAQGTGCAGGKIKGLLAGTGVVPDADNPG